MKIINLIIGKREIKTADNFSVDYKICHLEIHQRTYHFSHFCRLNILFCFIIVPYNFLFLNLQEYVIICTCMQLHCFFYFNFTYPIVIFLLEHSLLYQIFHSKLNFFIVSQGLCLSILSWLYVTD